MNTKRIKKLILPCLLVLCALSIWIQKRCVQADRIALDSPQRQSVRLGTADPSSSQQTPRNNGTLSPRIKCSQRVAFNELPRRHGDVLISEPSGWVELAPAGGGAKRWHRLFVQTSITPSVSTGEIHIGREQAIRFEIKGRYACVPCDSDGEMAAPPADDLEGDGMGNWSAWQEWPRVARAIIDEKSGAITFKRDLSDSQQPGDTFNNSFRLWTDLSFSPGEGKVTCSANSKHPFGGISEDRKAEVVLTRSK